MNLKTSHNSFSTCFALFCSLIAVTLGENSVKGLRVTKIVN